jgi:hypothetical protein
MANFIDASSATITGAFLKSAGFVVNGLGVASVNGMHTIASVSPTCSATGIGSGGTCTFNTIGSTTFAGQIILTIGSGAAATGLVTITPTVTGNTTCVANPTNNSGIWNLSATTWMSGVGPTPVIGWSNSGTALTAGLLYLIAYICVGF